MPGRQPGRAGRAMSEIRATLIADGVVLAIACLALWRAQWELAGLERAHRRRRRANLAAAKLGRAN